MERPFNHSLVCYINHGRFIYLSKFQIFILKYFKLTNVNNLGQTYEIYFYSEIWNVSGENNLLSHFANELVCLANI